MINLSMQGNAVFPIIMRKVMMISTKVADWKDIMESGVRVKPKSLKAVCAEYTALKDVNLDARIDELVSKRTTKLD